MVSMIVAFLFVFLLVFSIAVYELTMKWRKARQVRNRLLRVIPTYNFVSPAEKRLMRYGKSRRRRIA